MFELNEYIEVGVKRRVNIIFDFKTNGLTRLQIQKAVEKIIILVLKPNTLIVCAGLLGKTFFV
ncbi:hypothetical protein DIE07_33065 [Burkholderia sp. Bp9002]|nr:hypothetical protein DIE07_33065 [Burkholderia sp. Bp9002]